MRRSEPLCINNNVGHGYCFKFIKLENFSDLNSVTKVGDITRKQSKSIYLQLTKTK